MKPYLDVLAWFVVVLTCFSFICVIAIIYWPAILILLLGASLAWAIVRLCEGDSSFM
jgi:hypothetical protein